MATVVLMLGGGWMASDMRAELVWTQKTAELDPDAQTAVVECRFPFRNDGTTPVDIEQVQTSCGCTTAALAQRHYEPGQGGEIVARFIVGERVGIQKKTILVTTTESPVATLLTLVVHVPELLRVEPTTVSWKQGEPIASKIIQVEAGPQASSIRDVSVQSSNGAMAAESQPVTEGSRYRIRVTPNRTDQPVFAALTIRYRVGGTTRSFRAFANVRGSQPASSAKSSRAGTPGLPPPAPVDPWVPPG